MLNDGIIHFGRLVGGSRKMRRVYTLIRKASKIDLPLLIIGETGVGKEFAAREVHERSARTSGPFVAVNTGALSAELVASELFGHKKGAFTGAVEDRIGRFREADHGTLFLDEIGTMDDRTQITLLRVLEERKFRPVGAKRDFVSDIRLICATNEDLDSAAEAGQFRNDLLYRLKVLCITIPPLRDRLEDLPMLCRFYIKRFNSEYNFQIDGLADEAYAALLAYPWPGNLRELRNVIAQSCVMAERGPITPEHLPDRIVHLQRNALQDSHSIDNQDQEPNEIASSPPLDAVPLAEGREHYSGGGGGSAASFREGAFVDDDRAPTPNGFAAHVENPHFPAPGFVNQNHAGTTAADAAPHAALPDEGIFIPVGATLEDVEKQYTLKTLAHCDNNKTQAAKLLGVSRKTLYDRLDRWGAN